MAKRKKRKSVALREKSPKSKDMCFTIMPYGGWFDDYYDSVYRPAIEKTGLLPKRADDLYRPSTIVNDVWTYTREAKIILADLSGKNPNVFYELGLAHALAKPAILITESVDDVPFDLRALRILGYSKHQPNWGEELAEKITQSIKEVLAAPLQAVLPAFLAVRNEPKPKAISAQEKAYLQLKKEFDLLRQEVNRSSTSFPTGSVPSTRSLSEIVTDLKKQGAAQLNIINHLVRWYNIPRGAATRFVNATLRTKR
jgi:hypothetical protein